MRLYWSRLVGSACDVFSVSQLFYGLLRKLFRKEIVLCATAGGVIRYLTAEMSRDYAGFLRLAMGQNNAGGGHAIPDLFRPTIRVPLRATKVG